jgi:hypothetical protein
MWSTCGGKFTETHETVTNQSSRRDTGIAWEVLRPLPCTSPLTYNAQGVNGSHPRGCTSMVRSTIWPQYTSFVTTCILRKRSSYSFTTVVILSTIFRRKKVTHKTRLRQMCLTTLNFSLAVWNCNRKLLVSATGCCIVVVSRRGKAETWESGSTHRSDTCAG